MVWPVLATIGQWCWHGYSVAGSSLQFAASLPPTCRESLAHAALTCGGMTPRYYTAGFAPLQLAWGWLVVGLLCGMLARTCAGAVLLRYHQAPSCRRQSPDARPQADICERWLHAADEVTRCFALGGEECIGELARQAGQPPVSLLCSLLQQAADASRTDGQHVPQVPARNGLQRRSGTSGRQPSISGRAAPPTKR